MSAPNPTCKRCGSRKTRRFRVKPEGDNRGVYVVRCPQCKPPGWEPVLPPRLERPVRRSARQDREEHTDNITRAWEEFG